MKYRSNRALIGVIAALIILSAPLAPALYVSAQTVTQTGPAVLTLRSLVRIRAGAFSPDGRLLVTGGDFQTLRLWDVVWGIPVHAFYGHQDTVQAVAYSPDGKHIASFGGNLLLWDATSGTLLHELKGFTGDFVTLAFSRDGSQLLSLSTLPTGCCGYDTFIQTWNVASGALIKEMVGPRVSDPVAVFSPDRRNLAFSYKANPCVTRLGPLQSIEGCRTLGLWDVMAGSSALGFKQSTVPSPVSRILDQKEGSFSFTPDGRSIVAGYMLGHIRVLNASSGALIRDMADAGNSDVDSVAVSPDGKVIAAYIGKKVVLWNTATGSLIAAPGSFGRSSYLSSSLAFSPDGKRIVSFDVSFDSAFRIWNAASGKLIATSYLLPEGNWLTEFFDHHYRASDGAVSYLKIAGPNDDLQLAAYEKLSDAAVPHINTPIRQNYVCANEKGDLPAAQRITACTDVIQSGWWAENDLAWAFNDRCWAYNDISAYEGHVSPERHASAVADCNEAAKRDPKNAAAYFNLGDAYRISTEYDQAIANYTRAVEVDSTFAAAFNNRGLAYFGKNDYDHAIADYAAAIKLDGNYARAFSNRGDAYRAKGDLNDAITDYTKTMTIDPTSAQPFAGRCKAYLAQRNYQQAVLDCTDAVRLSPDDASLYSAREAAYQALGHSLDTSSSACGANTVSVSSGTIGPLSVAEECLLKPMHQFKECDVCPTMVVVPAGTFTMGSLASEEGFNNERPQHGVTFKRSFAVSKFELTFDEWDACVADNGCNGYKPSDAGWGRGRRPVIYVSWDDANAYVAWVTKKSGKPYRLLTEAEYEYAARAGTTTAYPWGIAVGQNNANCSGCGSQWDEKQTAPVGSFAPNKFGLYDMVGNVLEWTQDCFHDSYLGAPADGSAWTNGVCRGRVTRSGSLFVFPISLRSAFRNWAPTNTRSPEIGFRVGRTLLMP